MLYAMDKTKIELHVELNEAYAKLLSICLLLDLKSYYEALERGRSFMSKMVDRSDLPSA